MANQISTQTISFNNQSLITVEQNGNHYVAMKPICENIGIDWRAQRQRIVRDEVLCSTVVIITTVAEDGKNREMLCLPIQYLNGWLFGIDINRCNPEIRDTLIKYKKECYQALHDYWFNGKAERKTTVDDRTGLRNAVNMLVSKKGLIYSDAYHLVHFTEHDLQQLVWAWFALLRGTELCQVLHPALKQIGSHYAASVYDIAYEYRSTLRQAHNVLTRITEQFKCEQGNNWRVLKYLRAYNPKATGFQLDIL